MSSENLINSDDFDILDEDKDYENSKILRELSLCWNQIEREGQHQYIIHETILLIPLSWTQRTSAQETLLCWETVNKVISYSFVFHVWKFW